MEAAYVGYRELMQKEGSRQAVIYAKRLRQVVRKIKKESPSEVSRRKKVIDTT